MGLPTSAGFLSRFRDLSRRVEHLRDCISRWGVVESLANGRDRSIALRLQAPPKRHDASTAAPAGNFNAASPICADRR
jgi:hypothetical protein